MKAGDDHVAKHDLSACGCSGSVGEPINPEAWMWYHERIGGGRCPIVDTWWQTETGSIMISPLPGITTTKPGSATHPLPGIAAMIVDEQGAEVPRGGGGYLVLKRPWPAMLRTLWGDDERFVSTYWSRFGRDVYFTGDGAKTDADGDFWLMGRVDDVINVAGHRISTTEIESSLVQHPAVAEAAAIGAHDADQGRADLRVRDHRETASSRPTSCARSCSRTSRRRSASSRGPACCCSRPTCRRRARARSCAGC